MPLEQLTIFSEEEMENLAVGRKNPSDKDLTQRTNLSNEESEKYNFPLDKRDMVEYVEKHNERYNLKFRQCKLTGFHLVLFARLYIFNKGIPQMTLRTLSQYSGKKQENLLVSDLLIMKKSIEGLFPEGAKYYDLRKFRKANKLSFFGEKQYWFMELYSESLKD